MFHAITPKRNCFRWIPSKFLYNAQYACWFIAWFICEVRLRVTDTHTHTLTDPTTIPLTAYANQGLIIYGIFNPRFRACAARVTVLGLCVCVCVCVCVCLSVSTYSPTTGTKPAHKGYQWLQLNKRSKKYVAISLKRRRSGLRNRHRRGHVAWPNPSIISSAHAYSFVRDPTRRRPMRSIIWCMINVIHVYTPLAVCPSNASWRIVLEGWTFNLAPN